MKVKKPKEYLYIIYRGLYFNINDATSHIFLHLVPIKRGNFYKIESKYLSIEEYIKIIPYDIFHSYVYDVLNDIKDVVFTKKDVKRQIKLGVLEENVDGTVEVVPIKPKVYIGYRKQGPILKKDSRLKTLRRKHSSHWIYNHGVNPGKRMNDPNKYYDPFEDSSSSVFGHPNLRFTLRKKKLQKGYRRNKFKGVEDAC